MLIKSRVLLFTTAFLPFVGGSEIAIDETTKRLSDFSIDIVTPRYRADLPALENRGNRIIHRIGIGSIIDKYIFPVSGLFYGLYLYRKRQASIVHAYQASFGALAAVFLKQAVPKMKLIITLQEGKELQQQSVLIRWLRRFCLRHADQITAISKYLADYARNICPGTPISIIANGVDPEHFKPAATLINRDPVIMTVSRLVPKNGIADLIEAFAIIKKLHLSATLQIIGDGPLRSALESQARSLDISDSVKFLGNIPYQSLPGHLSKAMIFARPSRSEGLGSAFLEAMACGVPVIGSGVGGIPDIIHDRETGLLCRAGDSNDLAQKISRLLDDPPLRDRLAHQARAMIEQFYSWDRAAEKFNLIYHAI